MRIVSGAQMREIDRVIIEEKKVPGVILMEAAGKGAAEEIRSHSPEVESVLIIAGKGNNGGDGFVIHRWLTHWGYDCTTLLLASRDEIQGDARINLEILFELNERVIEAKGLEQIEDFWDEIADYDLIIDGILGTGLSGEVRGVSRQVIEWINDIDLPIVAIDIPSGLDSVRGVPLGVAVEADLTVTFALPKLGLVLYPGQSYVGHVRVIDIGIPEQVLQEAQIQRFWMTEEAIREMLPLRSKQGHKGTYGRVFILAGSKGMTGAAALTSEAVLRSGAGLVTLGIPESLNPILEMKLTEVMTDPLPEEDGKVAFSALEQIEQWLERADVVAVGPGLGQSEDLSKLMQHLVKKCEKPLVIDADGINNLQDHLELLKERSALTVLTPHPGEMSRLTGLSISEVQADRVGVAERFAKDYGVVLVLKGAATVTALPCGQTYVNSTGNDGMGTGGTGDVLTGMIAGLLAQRIDQWIVPSAVYLHGLAGDLQVAETNLRTLVASDLLKGMTLAFNDLEK